MPVQVDEELRVGEPVDERARHLNGQCGLAAAGHTVQELDPAFLLGDLLDQPGHGLLAPGEVADRPGQRPDRRGDPAFRHAQHQVAAEHPLVQLLQRRAGLDAQLLGVDPAALPVDGERVRLPADRRESQHQLPSQPFPQRVVLDRLGQLVDQFGPPAQPQLDVDAVLQHGEPLLVERLGPQSHQPGRDTGERRTAPQRQRRPVVTAGLGKPADGGLGAGRLHGAGEHVGVEVVRLDPDAVARRVGDDGPGRQPERREPLPQSRHTDLELGPRGRRGTLLPDGVDQILHRHHPAGAQQQHGEHGAIPARGDGGFAAADPQGPQDPESHPRPRLPPCNFQQRSPAVTERRGEAIAIR